MIEIVWPTTNIVQEHKVIKRANLSQRLRRSRRKSVKALVKR